MRVQKPGGVLIIIGGMYKGRKYDERNRKLAELGNMAYHTPEELHELLSMVGYSEIDVHEDFERGGICAICKNQFDFLVSAFTIL